MHQGLEVSCLGPMAFGTKLASHFPMEGSQGALVPLSPCSKQGMKCFGLLSHLLSSLCLLSVGSLQKPTIWEEKPPEVFFLPMPPGHTHGCP